MPAIHRFFRALIALMSCCGKTSRQAMRLHLRRRQSPLHRRPRRPSSLRQWRRLSKKNQKPNPRQAGDS
jgi:hypothetical protein